MAPSTLACARLLRESGQEQEYLRAINALASATPDDVEVRMEAAYANDRAGNEAEAIRHYDAAWALGVAAPARQEFLVGYGSTLRNVGRTDDAVAVLGEAVAAFPGYAPLKAFLALALHAAGHGHAAMATMLDLLIDLDAGAPDAGAPDAGAGCLDGYGAALDHYRGELLKQAIEVSG